MSWYNWKNDIIDLDDKDACRSASIPDEMTTEAAWRCAQRAAREYGTDPEEEMSCIAALWAIPMSSRLFGLLLKWYGCDIDGLLEYVRCSVYLNGHLCFITGGNYAIWDSDLLGGKGTGSAEQEFDRFIENLSQDR